MNATQLLTKTVPRVVLCSATLLAAGALLAQAPPGGGGAQQPNMPQQPTSPTPGYPGATPGAAPPGQSFGDQAFVAKALEGSQAEVQLGQLAQEKSQSMDVKQFGQRMVNDHQQIADKLLKPVAKELGVSEPKGPSKKDKKLIAKLQTLSGTDFDNEYIKTMVKDHKQDLKDFQSEAQSAQDPNVKQAAQEGSGVIAKHLQMIEQIAQNHNLPLEGKQVSSAK